MEDRCSPIFSEIVQPWLLNLSFDKLSPVDQRILLIKDIYTVMNWLHIFLASNLADVWLSVRLLHIQIKHMYKMCATDLLR